MEYLSLGAHLVTPRSGYTHHGIYIGTNRVIHYSGLADGLDAGPIVMDTVEKFCRNNPLKIRNYESPKHLKADAIQRAQSRMGENSYNLITNNCEHFCTWVITGSKRSDQVTPPPIRIIAGGGYKDMWFDRRSPISPDIYSMIQMMAAVHLGKAIFKNEIWDSDEIIKMSDALYAEHGIMMTTNYTNDCCSFRDFVLCTQKLCAELSEQTKEKVLTYAAGINDYSKYLPKK